MQTKVQPQTASLTSSAIQDALVRLLVDILLHDSRLRRNARLLTTGGERRIVGRTEDLRKLSLDPIVLTPSTLWRLEGAIFT